jgi:hypothetical protein
VTADADFAMPEAAPEPQEQLMASAAMENSSGLRAQRRFGGTGRTVCAQDHCHGEINLKPPSSTRT